VWGSGGRAPPFLNSALDRTGLLTSSLAASFPGKETPAPISWEDGWAPESDFIIIIIIIIIIFIINCSACPSLDLGHSFSSLILYAVVMNPGMGNEPVARPLYAHEII
jgi:hypothetical protein